MYLSGAGAGLLMSTHLGHGGRRESDLGPPEKPSRPHPRKVRRRTTRIRHPPFRILILGPSAVVDLSKIRAAASRLDEESPHQVFRITEVRVDAVVWVWPPPISGEASAWEGCFIVHENLEHHFTARAHAAPYRALARRQRGNGKYRPSRRGSKLSARSQSLPSYFLI